MNKNLDFIYQLNNISNTYIDRSGRVITNSNQYSQKNLGNFIEIVPLKMNEGLVVEEPKPLSTLKTIRIPSKHYRIQAKNIKKETRNDLQNQFNQNDSNINNRINKYLNIINQSKRSSTADTSNRKNINMNNKMNNTTTNQFYNIYNKYNSNLNTINEFETNQKKIKNNTINKIEEHKNNNLHELNNEFQDDIYKKTNKLKITNNLNKTLPSSSRRNLKDISLMTSSNKELKKNDFSKTLYDNKIAIFENEISEKIQSLMRRNSFENSNNNTSLSKNNEKEDKNTSYKYKLNKKDNRANSQKENITERIIRIRKNYQELEKEMHNQNYNFYLILPGNASYLIKNCMNHRTNWKEPFSKVSTLFNFKWQEISYGIDYNNLSKNDFKQMVNHYENHYSITNKANMFCNLMKYCEERKISVFKYVPFTIVYRFKEKKKDKEEDIKSFEKENQEYKNNLMNFISLSDKFVIDYEDIGKYYDEENFINESNKKLLLFEEEKKEKKKTKKKKKKKKEKEKEKEKEKNKNEENNKFYYDFFPNLKPNDRIIATSVVNELEKDKIEKKNEKKKDKKKIIGSKTLIEIPKTHETGKHIWLVKAINLNRGQCIKIVNSFEQIEKVINKFKQGVKYGFTKQNIEEIEYNVNIEEKKDEEEKNKDNNEIEKTYLCKKIIIQKYIENPLLYKGRKCDIRIWVLLTHKMKVYVFKEGHLKTCSVDYDVNSKDAFTHITNYSFQKYNNNFQKFEKGNEVPFYEFQKFINEKYPYKNYSIKVDLMNKIKEIIILTMRAGKDKINKNNRNYQFEIFGYDFMLDNDFNVFLIEINTNPGLEESSPWIKIIIPRMLDDALRLTLDQIFDPKYDFNLNYKNIDDNNNIKNVNDNLKNNINPNSIDNNINNNNSFINVINKDEEKKNEEKENKSNNENNKNLKYISPFPVPGYNLDENLWDYICDLNEKDPLDDRLNNNDVNMESNKKNFTGIKHLIKKKNK